MFPEGCAFRAAADKQLATNGVPCRTALVSASGQVIHAAVAAGLAMTIMAAGTVPSDLQVFQHYGLPDLPSTCIQIVTRTHGLSAAMSEVRSIVAKVW